MGCDNYYQARTFLLVHHPGVENQNRLFRNVPGRSHAEQNFMEVYKNQYAERYQTKNKRVRLDVYLTFAPCGAPCSPTHLKGKNCATALRTFAEDYNFELNIKAAAPYENNKKELCELMTSRYCTVEAFTEEDYRNLAGCLGFQDNLKQPEATRDRDRKTQGELNEVSKNIEYYSMH